MRFGIGWGARGVRQKKHAAVIVILYRISIFDRYCCKFYGNTTCIHYAVIVAYRITVGSRGLGFSGWVCHIGSYSASETSPKK